ncbi:rCG57467, isoform CRA_b [Rattus norvegicus]|uniref:RCG57467, isoform CRA_b n=1 Tax=Rattus norvegicus TaxID=10116 RepID=A6JI75_RAT|nr:rCG57467, isoform CRA_b [Rattus norvegicus]
MMESVGVYGFCGCKGKSKVKCDSRWEITAAGLCSSSWMLDITWLPRSEAKT